MACLPNPYKLSILSDIWRATIFLLWEMGNDTYSLSVRVQTTINHISICLLPQYQRQRKCFSSERELKKALHDTLTRAAWYGLRHRLQGRGFQSKRFHDLEAASKTTRFQGVYTEPIQTLNPTVYVKAISFSGLCASSIGARFDQTRICRLSSPRPNPESSLTFLFVTLLERIDEKVNISRHMCLYLWGMALGL